MKQQKLRAIFMLSLNDDVANTIVRVRENERNMIF